MGRVVTGTCVGVLALAGRGVAADDTPFVCLGAPSSLQKVSCAVGQPECEGALATLHFVSAVGGGNQLPGGDPGGDPSNSGIELR